MTSYRDQSWNARVGTLGDEAEGIFESVCKNNFVRYGLNRPPVQVHKLGLLVRYTPDYMTTRALVEVQGFGQDQTIKTKHEKLAALNVWHQHHPVELFLWDSANKRFAFVPLDEFTSLLPRFGAEASFPEGKGYWALHAHHIEGWVDHEPTQG